MNVVCSLKGTDNIAICIHVHYQEACCVYFNFVPDNRLGMI